MRIEVLNEFPVSDDWAAKWNALQKQAAITDVFVTWEWMRAAAAFDPQAKIQIICGYHSSGDSKTLIGLAPLALRCCTYYGYRRNVLELLAGPWSDYNDFLIAPEFRTQFLTEVVEVLARFVRDPHNNCTEINLTSLPDDSVNLSTLIAAAQKKKLPLLEFENNVGPALQLAQTNPTELDELLEKKGTERKARTLAKKGKLEFRIVRQPEEIRVCLNKLYRLHTVRYLLNGQPSIFDPENQQALCRMLDSLADSDSIGFCLPTLFFNDEPIALTIGFEFENALTLYAMTFDIGVTGTSPGEILVLEIARYCRKTGLVKLDFGLGNEAYKNRFTNTRRRTVTLAIHRHRIAAQLHTWFSRIRHAIKQRENWYAGVQWLKGLAWQLKLERIRTDWWQAIKASIRQRLRLDSKPSLEGAVKSGTLKATELVDFVMTHRHDLPAWEFRQAYDDLREGKTCTLLVRQDQLCQILSEDAAEKPQSVGEQTVTSQRNHLLTGLQSSDNIPLKQHATQSQRL